MSSPVPSQITDAVTQTNTKVLADAPAMALGSLYQSLARASGLLFENAVAAQQQQAALAQVAASQGVLKIYSLDAVNREAATDQLAQEAQVSAAQLKQAHSPSAINEQITQAVQLSLEANLLHSGDVAYGVRAAADALAASIAHISKVQQESLLRTVQLAATSACLAAMLREPDKADAYGDVLQRIRQLG